MTLYREKHEIFSHGEEHIIILRPRRSSTANSSQSQDSDPIQISDRLSDSVSISFNYRSLLGVLVRVLEESYQQPALLRIGAQCATEERVRLAPFTWTVREYGHVLRFAILGVHVYVSGKRRSQRGRMARLRCPMRVRQRERYRHRRPQGRKEGERETGMEREEPEPARPPPTEGAHARARTPPAASCRAAARHPTQTRCRLPTPGPTHSLVRPL